MAEVRIFLERIEQYTASLSFADRESAAVTQALDAIAHDNLTRSRYLDFARNAESSALRVRMLKLAQALGWLSPVELRAEIMQAIADTLARSRVTAADVDLACAQNTNHELDDELGRLPRSSTEANDAAHADDGDATRRAMEPLQIGKEIRVTFGDATGVANADAGMHRPENREAHRHAMVIVGFDFRPVDIRRKDLQSITCFNDVCAAFGQLGAQRNHTLALLNAEPAKISETDRFDRKGRKNYGGHDAVPEIATP